MSDVQARLDELENRVVRLTRASRRDRAVIVGLAGVIGIGALGGIARGPAEPTDLKVRSLSVVDGENQTRVSITAADGSPSVTVRGTQDHATVFFGLEPDGTPRLLLRGASEAPGLVALGIHSDGTAEIEARGADKKTAVLLTARPDGGGRVDVRDSTEKLRASFGVDKEGAAAQVLLSRDSKARVSLGCIGDSPNLTLQDDAGQARVSLGWLGKRVFGACFSDGAGNPRSVVQVPEEGTPQIQLLDATGKTTDSLGAIKPASQPAKPPR